jgi:hypothetical protein
MEAQAAGLELFSFLAEVVEPAREDCLRPGA